MLVDELCTRDVVIAERQTSIQQVAKLMREYHVGDIVIVENNRESCKPVGIITDRDIVLELIAMENSLDSVNAGDIMGPELVMAKNTEGIWETLQIMRDKGIRRLPVIDDEQRLIGIISADDIFELLAEQMKDLAKLIGREQRQERNMRS